MNIIHKEPALSKVLQQELKQLLEIPNAGRLGQHLRRMFIDYIDHELEIGVPVYFDEFLYPLNCLFDFLDKVTDEVNNTGNRQEAGEDQPGQFSTAAERITAFIKATVLPEKIFLVSHPRQEDEREFFDFIIVMPGTAQAAFTDYEQVISIGCIHNSNVHVSLHQSANLYRQLEEGHIFYSFVCTPQNLVYDDGKVPLPKTEGGRLRLLKEKAVKDFTDGYEKAEVFLKGAVFYHQSEASALTAFMLQQATELTFRAVILSLTGNEVKTHSLNVLKRHSKRCAPGLNEIFPANNENEERILQLLDKAYLCGRYGSGFSITPADEILLLERVQYLQTKAREVFEERIGLRISNAW